MANKVGRNKKSCERYKAEGRREKNKAKKQVKAEKRLAYFAKRREEGKGYEYKPNPYDEGSAKWKNERNRRMKKNERHELPMVTFEKTMKQLERDLEQAKNDARKKASAKEHHYQKAFRAEEKANRSDA